MSETDINRIFDQLKALGEGQATITANQSHHFEMLHEVRADVKTLQLTLGTVHNEGCVKGQDDRRRIDRLERKANGGQTTGVTPAGAISEIDGPGGFKAKGAVAVVIGKYIGRGIMAAAVIYAVFGVMNNSRKVESVAQDSQRFGQSQRGELLAVIRDLRKEIETRK